MVLAMFMLAQRLSGYENKALAVIVFRAAITLSGVLVLAVIWDIARWGRNRKKVVLPSSRPKVLPDRYGLSPERITSEGLHVVNHGEVAFDVGVEPILLGDNWTVHFHGIRCLDKNGFLRATFHTSGTETTSSLDFIWRNLWEKKWESQVVALTITYKDSDGHSYRSMCEIRRDVTKYPAFDVEFIRQIMV